VNGASPRLSVILVTDRYKTVRKMVECLAEYEMHKLRYATRVNP
jgi:hypothetical protein